MILKLKDGDVKIQLFEDVAPNHVKRIKELADSGKYDNVVFHRVIDGFMAQTGDVKFGNSDSKEFDLMNKVAIYPGTFDPITYGHIDVIKKALKLFDKVVVSVSDVSNKNYLFNSKERIEIVNKALFKDLKLDKKKILVVSFNSLTTDLCKKYKSNVILRGLRAVSDFEYEFQLAGMNRKLNNNIETIFLMSDVENQIISSRFVKEIVKLNGDIRKFTTKSTIKSLKEKYE